mmetsp:Transcript_18036/g.37848  ORF Transcript_18036/g.37848 Transcript_18036/m.37848 type:complete len:279 (+) Transcript_18036:167-1003(+)
MTATIIFIHNNGKQQRQTTTTTTTTPFFSAPAYAATSSTCGTRVTMMSDTATNDNHNHNHNDNHSDNNRIIGNAPIDTALVGRYDHATPTRVGSSTTLLSIASSSSSSYTGDLVDTTNGAAVVKLDSGVTYRDLREGTKTSDGDGDSDGDVATEGKRVNIQWVLKRSNGYTIDASTNNDGVPFIFVVGGGGGGQQQQQQPRAIAGLDEGIRGMRVGGIRRIVIPPSLAYVEGLNDDGSSPGPVPVGFGPKQRIRRVMENRMDVPDESFLLDVKLTRIQ